MRSCAASYPLRATKAARRRLRQSRDALCRATPSRMTFYGARGIRAAMVWYRAVLGGRWTYNDKFGVARMFLEEDVWKRDDRVKQP